MWKKSPLYLSRSPDRRKIRLTLFLLRQILPITHIVCYFT